MTLLLAVAICSCLGGIAFVATPVILRTLPEPVLEAGEIKTPYAQLPGSRLAWGAGLWTFGLSLATVTALPIVDCLPFLVVALVGSIGCIIDAATTWLPKRILHVGWAVGLAALIGATLGRGGDPQWWTLGRALLGALMVSTMLLVAHVVVSFGLSDARLGVLTGGIAAWVSWGTLLSALVIGSIIGAAWGVLHTLIHGRDSPFPYGPSLLFGPYLAILLAAVMS